MDVERIQTFPRDHNEKSCARIYLRTWVTRPSANNKTPLKKHPPVLDAKKVPLLQLLRNGSSTLKPSSCEYARRGNTHRAKRYGTRLGDHAVNHTPSDLGQHATRRSYPRGLDGIHSLRGIRSRLHFVSQASLAKYISRRQKAETRNDSIPTTKVEFDVGNLG